MEESTFLQFKIDKLNKEVKELEEKLAGVDWDERARGYLAFLVSQYQDSANQVEDKQIEDYSRYLELSSKASNFRIENCSRNLRLSPSDFYVYDCSLQGVTSDVKFELTFVETVQGTDDDCGIISEVNAVVTMINNDPESLSGWLEDYTNQGDIPGHVNMILEFSSLARKRRVILNSLLKRSETGQLGSRYITIEGVEEKGVQVSGVGADENSIFSILWKISFCQATKSMMPSFEVEFDSKGFDGEALETFESLKKPFIKEHLLSDIWEAVAEALISYGE